MERPWVPLIPEFCGTLVWFRDQLVAVPTLELLRHLLTSDQSRLSWIESLNAALDSPPYHHSVGRYKWMLLML